MSVAQLSADELGTFAAIAVKLKLQSAVDGITMSGLMDNVRLCGTISIRNAEAWSDRYSETISPVTDDEIEAVALRRLADNDFLGHFGPICYNCRPLPAYVAELETACREWQDGERRRIERQAENDLAFAEVGPLPILTADDIPPTSQRVIYAEFRVDQSDSQSDYWGHRTVRRVVLGFANGKREDFRQLRKCAATFEPTKDMGPGCDDFTVYVVAANDGPNGYNRIGTGERSHWHTDEGHGRGFTTEADAVAFIASREPLDKSTIDGTVVAWEWDICRESIEHRETYSMGGGNYLGSSRHSGWIVRSTCPSDAVGMEWHNTGTTPPKARKAASTTVSVVRSDILRLAEVVELRKIADLVASGSDCEANRLNAKTRVVPGRVYTKVDVGTSGLLMVENSTGSVYGIKAYGQVNRRHYFGCVSEVTARFSAELPMLHPVSVALPTPADCYAQNV